MKKKEHGTLYMYRHGRCRCNQCRAANTSACSLARKKRQIAAGRGEIPAEVVHGAATSSNWGCKCVICSEGTRLRNADTYQRVLRGEIVHERGGSIPGCPCGTCRSSLTRKMKANNDLSRTAAHHNGYVWTGPELEIASRSDLTIAEIAGMLGRTFAAVATRRQLLQVDPRQYALLGAASASTKTNDPLL